MKKSSGLSPLKVLLIALGVFWGFGVLTGAYFSAPRREALPQIAPLVLQMQNLGQLHTIRYTIHDVYEHEHALQLDGWARSLPGADSLYNATTRNSVLVVADGNVEAGVDLTQVGPEAVSKVTTPEGIRLRVRLPHATIYPPDIHLRVMQHRRGLFWNDDNIVPEATTAIERRCVEATQKNGILATAEANAVRMLTDMQRVAGNPNVEFVF